MRNFFIIINLLFGIIIQGALPVHGSEAYRLTKVLNYETIDKNHCVEVIRGQAMSSDFTAADSELSHQMLEQLNEQIEELEENHQNIREEINQLNLEVDQARETLDEVIEEVFNHLSEHSEEFIEGTQEEQLAMIQENESVQEWQSYIEELHSKTLALKEKSHEISQIYETKVYEYKQLKEEIANFQDNSDELNACLLYPYSSENMDTPILWEYLDDPNLNNVITQVDHHLNDIVPMPYRKLKYQDIFDLYNRNLTDEDIQQELIGKQPLQLDESGKEAYAYSQELNLQDIEVLANMAYKDLFETDDYDTFVDNYIEAIDLKESQYDYIKSINEEALSDIQATLAQYLNTHELTNDASVEKIRNLHDKYQIKLVSLNDEQWEVDSLTDSGYYSAFTQLDFTEESIDEAVGKSGDQLHETPISSLQEETVRDNLKKDANHKNSSGLAFFQDELNQEPQLVDPDEILTEPQEAISLDLPKQELPQKLDAKLETPKQSTKESFLPTTGEAKPWTIGAIGLLVIGLILLLINRRIKRKRRQALEEIDLS